MTEINLQPIFDYLDEFKAEIKARFNELERRVSNLENSVDRLTKIVTTMQDEFTVINHRVDRLESKIL
jgi:uncharacterized coiled-coil protein SlyX